MTQHILSVLVENKPGVLARVSGLFARRGFNIDSLAVGETEEPSVSRMTIVCSAAGKPLDQITKQLDKLINVLKISELPHDDSVERELAMIKVGVGAGKRAEVLEIAEIFRAKVLDVDPDALTIEATGAPEKILALEEILRPYGIVEMVRTGRIALARGAIGLKPPVLMPVPNSAAS
ncbi:MAG: acetolactate synthase small subunit [Actinomycetota bacterium]|jgi:acetolactate synthase-1/3 small subunit|nr:acetolactate synthase small subunit [Actinomycetota bacterium]